MNPSDLAGQQAYQRNTGTDKANCGIWLHRNASWKNALQELQIQGPARQDSAPQQYEGECSKPRSFPGLGIVIRH